jgi:hypothetical protein
MHRSRKPVAFALVVIALVGLFAGVPRTAGVNAQDAASDDDTAAVGHVTTSPVYWDIGTAWAGTEIPGARSSLVTFAEGASVAIETAGLQPGHAVTLWWVVFNNPEACTHGDERARCGADDLAEEAVEPSVLGGDGHIVGPDGKGLFSSFLATGDATTAIEGAGLTNPQGADIHFVLRTHGPVQPGLLETQLQTFGGGCNDSTEELGTPGDYMCANVQFAVHEQTAPDM